MKRLSKIQFTVRAVLIVICAIFVFSCKNIGKNVGLEAAKALGKAIESASTQIDNAITKVQNTTKEAVASAGDAAGKVDAIASDYQNILEELKRDLPNEVRGTIDHEVQNMIDNTVGITGAEFRCNIDFLGTRLIQKLQNLKKKLLGQTIFPAEPSLCQVVPSSIDLGLEPNRRNQIEVYGYDLNNMNNLKVIIEKNDNTSSDATMFYSKTSNYKGVINLSANGIQVNAGIRRVLLRVGDKNISEIPVLKPTPKFCVSRTDAVQPNSITIMPSNFTYNPEFEAAWKNIGQAMPNLCEAPWQGNPTVRVNVEIVQNVNNIEAISTMVIEGTKLPVLKFSTFVTAPVPVPVTAAVSTRSVLYNAPPKYSIANLAAPNFDFVQYQDSNTGIDKFNGSNGLVREFLVMGRANGCDVGSQTKVDIHFNNIAIELKENSDCVDEYEFKSLVMNNQISPATFKNAIKSSPKLKEISTTLPADKLKTLGKQ